MTMIRVGNSAEPSAVRTYHQLRERRLCDLLGLWVSGLEPMVYERVDVSPQVLVEVGIGIEGVAPQFVAQVTVDQMIEAGAIGLTYAVQHNPNRPKPFLVRLPRGVLDLKAAGLSTDAIGYGLTFLEAIAAAQDALTRPAPTEADVISGLLDQARAK